MAMKRTLSSQREQRTKMSESAMRKPLTKKQNEQVDRLMAKPDSEIDYSDIPETVGTLYKPIKRPIRVRIEADVLAWLKSSPGYQTRVNSLLREAMKARK